MSKHDVEMGALFRTIADEARLPVEAEHRLLSAARRKRRLTAGVAALSVFVTIGGIAAAAMLWNPADDPSARTRVGGPGQEGGRVQFDETSGKCVGDVGAPLGECEDEVARVWSTLKNAATAQESFATTTRDGRYTERLSDLEDQGFEEPGGLIIEVFGPSISDNSYCIEVFSKQIRGTLHYSSMVGSPKPGPCYFELKSILKNAATAEESHAVANQGRYTDDISDLEEEGLELRDGIELIVMAAGDEYCIEAVSVEVDATFHFSSNTGMPEPGPCPRDNTG